MIGPHPEKMEVPANLADQFNQAKLLLVRNGWPLRLEWNLHLNACGLRLRKKLIWGLRKKLRWEPGGKTTKASDQLELVSLKESIIQKAWAGWEEGLRLGHRKMGDRRGHCDDGVHQ